MTRPPAATPNTAPDDFYSRVAQGLARQTMRDYSTSFSAACALLPRAVAADIASVYGLVRVADEIVDGSAGFAGLAQEGIVRELTALEEQTLQALNSGYSSNPIVHAFAGAARKNGFEKGWVTAFFASMLMDTGDRDHGAELDQYIYGSAEVIGLMCTRVFWQGQADQQDLADADGGARALGRAFQLVNFLRDAGTDYRELGRDYLGLTGVDAEARKILVEQEVFELLNQAKVSVTALPRSARSAVLAAVLLYQNLTKRIRSVTAEELIAGHRISVPSLVKIRLLLTAVFSRNTDKRPLAKMKGDHNR